jgi:hypothetical protein
MNILEKKNFQKIRLLTWEEVFSFWFDNEGTNPDWINTAKERGFNSWSDWRMQAYALPFGCNKADWSLYEVEHPEEIIGDFYGGPFSTWIRKFYEGKREQKFSKLAKNIKLQESKKIQNIIANFPVDKIIICLELNKNIYVIEGMHRSTSLAIMKEKGIKAQEKVLFAIGKSNLKELPLKKDRKVT